MTWNVSELGYTSNQEVLQADCHHIDARGHERITFFDPKGAYASLTRRRAKDKQIALNMHRKWKRSFLDGVSSAR